MGGNCGEDFASQPSGDPPKKVSMNELPELSTHELNALSSGDLLRLCMEAKGCSPRDLAAITRNETLCIGHKPALIENWLSGPGAGSVAGDPLHRAQVILEVTDRLEPLAWLCARLGGVMVFSLEAMSQRLKGIRGKGRLPGQELEPETRMWLEECQRINHFQQLLLSSCLSGQGFDKLEREEISLHWLGLKTWVESYVQAMEGGRQGTLRRPREPVGAARICPSWMAFKAANEERRDGTIHQTDRVRRTAARLKVSVATVQKWQQDCRVDQSGTANPFEVTAGLCQALGTTLPVQWLCARRGSIIAPGTGGEGISRTPWPRIYLEITEYEAAIGRAAITGKLEPENAAALRREWNDVRRWMAAFLTRAAK